MDGMDVTYLETKSDGHILEDAPLVDLDTPLSEDKITTNENKYELKLIPNEITEQEEVIEWYKKKWDTHG